MKSNILFIINPISGGKEKQKIPALIHANLDHSKFAPNFSYTSYVGHASEIAEEAAHRNFDIIVAVGGDGTINEIAAKVLQYNKILGIIPLGSGNGLARSLKIPMDIKRAVQVLNNLNVKTIDAAKLNQRLFFNVAGIGFDAHISSAFVGHKTRGLSGYAGMVLREFKKYQAENFTIHIDGKTFKRQAFLLSIANSSQYGNNVFISPQSDLTDGLLELCIIKPLPWYKFPWLGLQMLSAKTHRSAWVEIMSGKQFKIYRDHENSVHIDGEPLFMGKEIDVHVIPNSLKVITPQKE